MCSTFTSSTNTCTQVTIKVASMNPLFPGNLVRPNLPLRKPSSCPMTPPIGSSAHGQLTMAAATPVRPATCADVKGSILSPASRDIPAVLGSSPSALTAYTCNFCGQKGYFRCKRCKKTPYCSVVCQTEDWKAHRNVCKSDELEEKPKETTALPEMADKGSLLESKHVDASSTQRVYLKDLYKTKVFEGTEMQASCVEFYSPGRFFLLAQSPEMFDTLRSISTELQKTYSCPSASTYVPCVEEVCAVQFSCDMNWYRGLIQNLAADQKTANVLYIDFGNQEDVQMYRIRPLAANIQRFCPCAMECQIAGVVPVDDNWSGNCCIAVRQLLVGKTVTAKLVETQKNSLIHTVDILLSSGKQLSAFLLEQGFAAKERVNVVPTAQEIRGMVSASLENFRRHSDGKDDNNWAHPPEPLTQAVGDSFSVVVTHFQSPDEMILQKVENAGGIQELQLQLREHCYKVPAPQNFRPAPGTVCCAQFSEDKQWYRANVLAYSSEERICVGYLDFGNSEEVDLGHLRPISPALLALPMQAIPCGLAGVQPVAESWSEECLLALRQRVSNRILRTEIQGAHDGKALVAMSDESSDPQADIAELLISAGYATPALVKARGDQQVDQAAAAAAAEPSDSTPVDEPLVWSSIQLPSDGQTVALLVSVVGNPGEFFCRVDSPKNHQQLIELRTEMKLHCEEDSSPFEPKEGEPCCAIFFGDGACYRTMVTGQSEDKVAVHFVDYGFDVQVEKRHLRSITSKLLKLPFQAIRCWLTGVEPLGTEWSSEAVLWFQALVDGERLSARVVSVTEQGYGVELKSRGQNVASALISEQLGKIPGEIPKETYASTSSAPKHQDSVQENEHSQIQTRASNETERSNEISSPEPTVAAPPGPSFPVDWKTMELPLGETFQPYIAAVTSPSLFYLVAPVHVDQQTLQEVMIELAAYCSNNQATLSSADKSRLAPGAACCAQFSSDNTWYRAVLLEVHEDEMSVLYADFGNTEKVPVSRILPIPIHLLQLPFQITRCTLAGKEHFPAEWSEDVQQLFKSLLLNDVLATVQSFEDSTNILSLALPAGKGGRNVTTIILDALQTQSRRNAGPSTTVEADQTESITSTTGVTAAPDCPQPKSVSAAKKCAENMSPDPGPTITQEPPAQTPQQRNNTHREESVKEDPVQKIVPQMEPANIVTPKINDPQTSECSCLSLMTKIDHLVELVQLQLSLMNQLVGQTN